MGNLACPLCCGQHFSSVTELRSHLEDLIIRPVICPVCDSIFGSLKELLDHLDSMHSDEGLGVGADEAEQERETKEEEREEEEEEEDDMERDLSDLLSNGNVFSCTSCSVQFTSLEDHIRKCHPTDNVVVELPAGQEGTNEQPTLLRADTNDADSLVLPLDVIEEAPDNEEEEDKVRVMAEVEEDVAIGVEEEEDVTEEEEEVEPEEKSERRRVRRAPTHKLVYHCHNCGEECKSRLEWRTHYRRCQGVRAVEGGSKEGSGDKTEVIKGEGEERVAEKASATDGWEQGPLLKSKFRCLECGNIYDKSYRRLHEMIHKGETPFECPSCKKGFYTRSNLNIHLRTHSGDKPYCCSHCHKTFRDTSTLKSHQVVHTGERPLRCHYCPKSFARATERILHERIHTGERPHVCNMCGKSFRVSYCLRLHQRTHTGERPYVCHLCPKMFKSSSVLQHHIKRHSEKKAFTCELCGKSFKTTVQLLGHKKTHTKPFACAVCTRRFATLYAVKQHLNAHATGHSKFNCTICGASYGRGSALRDHMIEAHKVVEQVPNFAAEVEEMGEEVLP